MRLPLAALGFRPIQSVRVVVGPHGSRAEVCGVTHRYPRSIEVSLATATRLAGAGVPLDVVQRDDVLAAERAG